MTEQAVWAMRRILVATDGSEGAGRAIDYAAHFAKTYGTELLIVNVSGREFPEELFARFTHAQQAWVEETIESLSAEKLTRAREQAEQMGASRIVLESRKGDVAQAIIEIAQEKAADLIVVGKRGAGRLAGLLLGSVSQKLVSLAPYPVTVIP